MNAKIAKISVKILGALLVFLAGYLFGNKNKRKEKAKAVKKAIIEVNTLNKKALQKHKSDFEEKVNKQNEVIDGLKDVIERLVPILKNEDSTGTSSGSTKRVKKLINTLNALLDKLNNL